MTTTHSSAAEAARPTFEAWLKENPDARFWNTTDAMLAAFIAGRAALSSQQEVAAPVGEADMLQVIDERDSYHEVADDLAAQIAAITGQEIGEHSSANDPWRNAMLAADEFIAQQLRDMVVAASRVPVASEGHDKKGRWEQHAGGHWNHYDAQGKLDMQSVPVASPAEPVPKLAGSPFESYVAQVIHAAFADGWGSCRDAEFAGDEAMNDAFNQSATLGVCLSIDQSPTHPVGAGGAGVMDARPDSVHSDSGECDRVQRVELSGDELALFQQTLEDFADCGETETDYEVLVNWAQRGLLECINFQPTAAAHRMLSSITSTDQKGNAA